MLPLDEVLAVILGGGRGTRLFPLTTMEAKPAVPIAGQYRLIDIPISNCINSGIYKIAVLTQFNSVSCIGTSPVRITSIHFIQDGSKSGLQNKGLIIMIGIRELQTQFENSSVRSSLPEQIMS